MSATLNRKCNAKFRLHRHYLIIKFFFSHANCVDAEGHDSNTQSKSSTITPSDISPIGATKIEQKFVEYVFPKQTDGRSFQSKWLNSFEWLEYSKERDAAFCYPCRQFSIAKANDIFTCVGFTNWSKALAKNYGLKKHGTSSTHLSAMVAWKEHELRLANNLEISTLVNDTVLKKRQYYFSRKSNYSTIFSNVTKFVNCMKVPKFHCLSNKDGRVTTKLHKQSKTISMNWWSH